jgi:hypothetical protein
MTVIKRGLGRSATEEKLAALTRERVEVKHLSPPPLHRFQ